MSYLKQHISTLSLDLLAHNEWMIDSLTAPLVNAQQHTKSTLIESKHNKSIEWLEKASCVMIQLQR